MPRAYSSLGAASAHSGADFHADAEMPGRALTCAHCTYGL